MHVASLWAKQEITTRSVTLVANYVIFLPPFAYFKLLETVQQHLREKTKNTD